MKGRTLALVVLLVTLTAPDKARAFCRTSVCELAEVGQICNPAQQEDCGVALAWKERCIGFSVQRDGSAAISSELAAEMLTTAFEAWRSADCAGGSPHFFVKRMADAACAHPEYNIDLNIERGNANVVMFHDDVWPHEGLADVLALTTLSYDVDTGEILDVDIEINMVDTEFTTDDSAIGFDLRSTLQHETGHLLGLAHSPDADSVMNVVPREGSLAGRVPSADDIAAICEVYPPDEAAIDASCDPTPLDFSPNCGGTSDPTPSPADEGGCSMASITSVPAGDFRTAALLLALFFGAAAARRRRHCSFQI